MLSQLSSQGSVKRAPPHCRTCGKPMKGHKSALCQLASPSDEVLRSRSGRSIQTDEDSDTPTASDSGSPPPPTATQASSRPSSSVYVDVPRRQRPVAPQGERPFVPLSGRPQYSYNPIDVEPSWQFPVDDRLLHRRNPHIANPLVPVYHREDTPFSDTGSMEGTELVEPLGDTGSECERASTVTASSGRLGGYVDSTDSLSNSDDSTENSGMPVVSSQVRALLRQANILGLDATLVRPPIGYRRNRVCIRANSDADRYTTVFVHPSDDNNGRRDGAGINMIYNEDLRSGSEDEDRMTGLRASVKFWSIVFSAMFVASLGAGWVNSLLFL